MEHMAGFEIKPVTTGRERMKFIKMPWQVYARDSHWVPPLISDQKTFLDPEKGVFFDHGEASLFVAYRDGRPVGRISAHVNRLYDEIYQDGKGFFGFFECENSQETASALFACAEEHLRARGKSLIEGPLSFGVYDEVGVLIDGFDTDPYLLNIHNPPYYRDLIENAGYGKSVDWFAYRGYLKDYLNLDERFYRVKDKVMQRAGLTLRQIDLSNVEEEAKTIQKIFNTAWDRNWGHVPFTDREIRRFAGELVRVAVPELSLIAERNGEPVGFTFSTCDANVAVKKINGRLFPFGFLTLLFGLKKTDRFRLILMGVLEEYRGRGIENALYMNVAKNGMEMGFRELEMSLVVETNVPMVKIMEKLPVKIYKTYRLFSKSL
jgi:GNAT superfamily N-acetyltransferase